MWFKNIYLFNLSEPFALTQAQLQERLLNNQARPCGKLERTTLGWAPPLGSAPDRLVYQQPGYDFINAQKYEKLLPASVIRDHVNEKIAKIESEEVRKVGGKDQRNLLDDVLLTLLPQAFSRSKIIGGYIDRAHQWLVINTASATQAEEFTQLLRQSLSSLKLTAFFPVSMSNTLTDWVKTQRLPARFNLESYCEMHDPNATSTVIRCINQDLGKEEVQKHLDAGKKVTQLELTWNDQLTFVLDYTGVIKRIRFLELMEETREAIEAETAEEQLAADFTLMSATFVSLLSDLSEGLGLKEQQLEAETALLA